MEFCGMCIPGYRQIVSPLCRVTWKKNYFEWGLEQQQSFEQLKQDQLCKMYSRLQPGSMVSPGASGRKQEEETKVEC